MKWYVGVFVFASLFALGYLLTSDLLASAFLGVLGSLLYFVKAGGRKYVQFVPYAQLIAFALSSTSVSLAFVSLVVKSVIVVETSVFSFITTVAFISASMVLGYLRRVKE